MSHDSDKTASDKTGAIHPMAILLFAQTVYMQKTMAH
jgi:hypothetical protein